MPQNGLSPTTQIVLAVVSIVAIIAGPLFTLLLQRWTENRREKRQTRQYVFRTLMMYRATPLNPQYVQALNLIDVVFNSKRSAKEELVRKDWKIMLDHLNNNKDRIDFGEGVRSHSAKLLSDMGACLGYNLDEVYMKRHAYQPQALANIENEQQSLRTLLLEVLRGNKRIPVSMFPEDFPELRLPTQSTVPNIPETVIGLRDE